MAANIVVPVTSDLINITQYTNHILHDIHKNNTITEQTGGIKKHYSSQKLKSSSNAQSKYFIKNKHNIIGQNNRNISMCAGFSSYISIKNKKNHEIRPITI